MRLRRTFFACTWLAMSLLASLPVHVGPAAAGPALVFEADTGRVLYAELATQLWYPASVVKLMTAYLTFAAVRDGRLDWNGTLHLSDNARGQPATRMGLRAGLTVTIEQTVKALIMRSATKGTVHKKAASRKVSRLTQRVAKLAKA